MVMILTIQYSSVAQSCLTQLLMNFKILSIFYIFSFLFVCLFHYMLQWSRAKTNRVFPRKCTGHSKHPLPTTKEKTLHIDITRWSTPKLDWLYSLQPKMEKLYRVNRNKTRSWLWLRSWTPYCQIHTQIAESRENH